MLLSVNANLAKACSQAVQDRVNLKLGKQTLEHQIRMVDGILIHGRISESLHKLSHCLFYNQTFFKASFSISTLVRNMYTKVS